MCQLQRRLLELHVNHKLSMQQVICGPRARTLFLASTLDLCISNSFTTFAWPSLAAWCSGVHLSCIPPSAAQSMHRNLTLSSCKQSAFARRSSFAALECPLSAARCRGDSLNCAIKSVALKYARMQAYTTLRVQQATRTIVRKQALDCRRMPMVRRPVQRCVLGLGNK